MIEKLLEESSMPMNYENQGQMAVITGYGAITNIGSNTETVWSALNCYQQEKFPPDSRFSPFNHRGFVEFDTSSHIKKHSHLRGMCNSQIASTCAAGMALDKAGLKSRTSLLEAIPVIFTCNGGSRDDEVEGSIVRELAWSDACAAVREETLNKLLRKIRPTLFLTQLPNLFTANIAINLGVTGECATILGEEDAGIDAFEIAYRRIASGQNDVVLVGGAFDGSDRDLHMSYAYSGLLQRGQHCVSPDSFSLGSAASFIVLESLRHAQSRGACVFARVCAVEQNVRVNDDPASLSGPIEALQTLLRKIEAKLRKPSLGVLLGSVGKGNIEEEAKLWKNHGEQNNDPQIRAVSGILGYLREASFTTYINIAIGCLQKERMYRGTHFDSNVGLDVDSSKAVDQVAVSIIGKYCGEAIVLLDAEKVEAGNG